MRTDTPDIATVMAELVDGDVAAYEPFYQLATPAVRRLLLAEFQARGIWTDSDRLDDLVGDCLLELIRLAPGWRADGGAKPWRWARQRLVNLAFAGLGFFADDLDDHDDLAAPSPRTSSVDDDDAWRAFELLTELNRAGRALRCGLERVATERDRRVWLDVLDEQGSGNASPAVTVAQTHGLTPHNVRKICQRVRERLVRLATSEPAYAALLDLLAVAA